MTAKFFGCGSSLIIFVVWCEIRIVSLYAGRLYLHLHAAPLWRSILFPLCCISHYNLQFVGFREIHIAFVTFYEKTKHNALKMICGLRLSLYGNIASLVPSLSNLFNVHEKRAGI